MQQEQQLRGYSLNILSLKFLLNLQAEGSMGDKMDGLNNIYTQTVVEGMKIDI